MNYLFNFIYIYKYISMDRPPPPPGNLEIESGKAFAFIFPTKIKRFDRRANSITTAKFYRMFISEPNTDYLGYIILNDNGNLILYTIIQFIMPHAQMINFITFNGKDFCYNATDICQVKKIFFINKNNTSSTLLSQPVIPIRKPFSEHIAQFIPSINMSNTTDILYGGNPTKYNIMLHSSVIDNTRYKFNLEFIKTANNFTLNKKEYVETGISNLKYKYNQNQSEIIATVIGQRMPTNLNNGSFFIEPIRHFYNYNHYCDYTDEELKEMIKKDKNIIKVFNEFLDKLLNPYIFYKLLNINPNILLDKYEYIKSLYLNIKNQCKYVIIEKKPILNEIKSNVNKKHLFNIFTYILHIFKCFSDYDNAAFIHYFIIIFKLLCNINKFISNIEETTTQMDKDYLDIQKKIEEIKLIINNKIK